MKRIIQVVQPVPRISLPSPSNEDIRAEIARIREHRKFCKAIQVCQILDWTVDQTLAGNEATINEGEIGIKALDLGREFKPLEDATVRQAMGQLRKKLAWYYLNDGLDDAIQIDYEERSYIPQFRRRVPPGVPLQTEGFSPVDGRAGGAPVVLDESIANSRNERTLMAGKAPPPSDTLAPTPQSFSVTSFGPGILLGLGVFFILLGICFWLLRRYDDGETLRIGLAEFTPTSDKVGADQFRARLQSALGDREGGGPSVQVELLRGSLDASASDRFTQARALCNNRDHIVIGATLLGNGQFKPIVQVVRPFGYPYLSSEFAAVLNGLTFQIDDKETNLTASIQPGADLVKILYAFRFTWLNQDSRAEQMLADLHDKVLGAAIIARHLSWLAMYGSLDESVARHKRALTVIGERVPQPREQICNPQGGRDEFSRCLALLVRASTQKELGSLSRGEPSRVLLDGALKDGEIVAAFFAKQGIDALTDESNALLAESDRLMGLTYELGPSQEMFYVRSSARWRALLNHLMIYSSPAEKPAIAEAQLGLGNTLLLLAPYDNPRDQELGQEAMKVLARALSGCSEVVAPAGGWHSPTEIFFKAKSYFGYSGCGLDNDSWAFVQETRVFSYAASLGTATDDGTLAARATASYEAAMKVLSETHHPLHWASCNRLYALVHLGSRPSDGAKEKLEQRARKALVAINYALRIYTVQYSPEVWGASELVLAEAEIQLGAYGTNKAEREGHWKNARSIIERVKQTVGSDTIQRYEASRPLKEVLRAFE